jgi:exonuclease SbcD
MRILHTSDWHLGKRLFKLDRSAEHEVFLDWLLCVLVDRDIDVLLIAGDIFDTPNPAHQAQDLYYRFLYRVSTQTKTQTYIIAGNHDSGMLLEAPRGVLQHHRVKVWGRLSSGPENHWVTLKKGEEEIDLCAIPFFRSHELLPQGEGDALLALSRYLKRERVRPQILLLHHLAGLYEAAGSEQVVSLSGVDSIPSELLKDFDYVALGHIHKPQKIGPKSYYSGSPIPLRFSETLAKSVVIIDGLTPEVLPVPVSRPLVVIKASEENWKDKIRALEIDAPLTPVVEVQMTLSAPKAGLIDEIKTALEKKNMELLSFMPLFTGEERSPVKNSRLFELGTVDLFKEFYHTKFPDGGEVPPDLMEDFISLIEKVKHAPPQA